MSESEADPSEELLELTRALSAHVAWHVECGTTGLPRASATTSIERGALEFPAASRAPERAALERAPAGRPSQPVAEGPHRSRAEPPRAEPPRDARTSGAASSAVPNAARPERAPAPAAGEPAGTGARPPAASAARSAGPSEDAHRRLAVLAQEVSGCTKCDLHAGRKQTVFARGTGKSGLCFVGEGPGADEDQQGFPFVGAAGQLLDRMIAAMGFARDDVYVCNIVKCRPPNNRKPEPAEMAACMPYLAQQLELVDPEVIVALGATAVEGLFGPSVGITKLRGRFKLYQGRIAVMPTFHPAYLLRNPAAKKDVWSDLQQVMRQMGREAPKR